MTSHLMSHGASPDAFFTDPALVFADPRETPPHVGKVMGLSERAGAAGANGFEPLEVYFYLDDCEDTPCG